MKIAIARTDFRPVIANASRVAWAKRSSDAVFVRPDSVEFSAIPSDFIGYAVMEPCLGSAFPIHIVPLDAGWSDLGVWDAVWNVLPKDENGNVLSGDVLTTGSRNTLLHAKPVGQSSGR